MFAQVSGLGCIDLGDRRSRVQISAARQRQPRLLAFELVVVTVRVLGAFVAVVFVDEDAFLVGEELVAVPAPVAFAAQDECAEY